MESVDSILSEVGLMFVSEELTDWPSLSLMVSACLQCAEFGQQ